MTETEKEEAREAGKKFWKNSYLVMFIIAYFIGNAWVNGHIESIGDFLLTALTGLGIALVVFIVLFILWHMVKGIVLGFKEAADNNKRGKE